MDRKQLTITALVILSLCTVIGVYAGTVGVNNLFGFTNGYGFTDLNSTNINAGTEFYRGGVNYTQFLLTTAGAANPFDQDLNTTDAVTFVNLTLTGDLINTFNATQTIQYPQEQSTFTVFIDGATYFAKNGNTGEITTDATPDLGALINSLIATSNNVHIEIREGNYTAATQIAWTDKFVHLEGAGTGTQFRHRGTVIAKGFNGALFLISYTNSDFSGFIIEDMYLDGASSGFNGRGVSVNNSKGFRLENMIITDFEDEPIYFTNCGWHRLFNIFVSDSYSHLIYYENCVDWIWVSVEADTCLDPANNTDAVHLVNSQGEITNGHFESGATFGRYGIFSDNQITVVNSRIAFCGSFGIQLFKANKTKLIGNTIWNTDLRDGPNGVGINIQASDVLVEANSIEDRQIVPTMEFGIRESGVGFDRSRLLNNIIQGMKTSELSIAYPNSLVRYNSPVDFRGLESDWIELGGVNRTTWPTAAGLADQNLNTTDSVVFQDLNITDEYNLGTQLDVNATINVNFEWTGQSAVLRAGENIAQGDLVYIDSSGDIQRTDADSNVTVPCVALALEAITNGNSGPVLMQGWIYNSAWTLAEGDEVFVSTAVGALTSTAPAGAGDQVQVIGIGLTEGLFWFNPDYTVLEIT